MNQILLIEADPSIGASLQDGFRASGFALRGVTDLRQARTQLAEALFTTVLLDVNLPESRIYEIGSPEVSNASRSLVLYLSCEPLVECPCGWVISVTCTSAGRCSRRTSSATSTYASTSAG